MKQEIVALDKEEREALGNKCISEIVEKVVEVRRMAADSPTMHSLKGTFIFHFV